MSMERKRAYVGDPHRGRSYTARSATNPSIEAEEGEARNTSKLVTVDGQHIGTAARRSYIDAMARVAYTCRHPKVVVQCVR